MPQISFPKKARTASVLTAAALFASLTLAGCHTIQGAGEDIEAGGEAIQDSSEETRKSL